ncbi:hypothetical protein BDF19DRAFT_415451 [Syncephalis fuscata]|nr:hypothetical protein BDF19DRAFT_415451 [Syncephalis fuscata]
MLFSPVNASDPAIQNIINNASKYPDFALVIERINQATNGLIQQSSRMGLPPVKLLILSSYRPPHFYLGYNCVANCFDKLQNRFSVSSSIRKALMKTFDYNIPWEISKNYTNFHYTAEQEPNPWNEIFFSHTYIAYKWTYFAIVLGVLLYACIRTIMLARFKLLKRNLLLIAFVISFIYCIFFLIHLTALHNAYVSPILFNVYMLLSGIPFDIIFCIGPLLAKNYFQKKHDTCLAYYYY